jgi:hypothetical protein
MARRSAKRKRVQGRGENGAKVDGCWCSSERLAVRRGEVPRRGSRRVDVRRAIGVGRIPDHADLVKDRVGTEFILLHCVRCRSKVAMRLDAEQNVVAQWILPGPVCDESSVTPCLHSGRISIMTRAEVEKLVKTLISRIASRNYENRTPDRMKAYAEELGLIRRAAKPKSS